jgi:hypothetical protein
MQSEQAAKKWWRALAKTPGTGRTKTVAKKRQKAQSCLVELDRSTR